MELIDAFVNDSIILLEKRNGLKNNVIAKTKVLQENKISIEILEKNLGIDNKYISELRKTINDMDDIIEIKELVIIEEKLKEINVNCLKTMNLLLGLHYKIIKDTYKDDNEIVDDPIGVEISKLLWGEFDNLQLRADPPIYGIYKDELRVPLDKGEGKINTVLKIPVPSIKLDSNMNMVILPEESINKNSNIFQQSNLCPC